MAHKWSVHMVGDDLLILHIEGKDTRDERTHVVAPSDSRQHYDYLGVRRMHWGNISCTCGHWHKIPRPIIEQFMATYKLLRSAGC
jgi:hypothetical protein